MHRTTFHFSGSHVQERRNKTTTTTTTTERAEGREKEEELFRLFIPKYDEPSFTPISSEWRKIVAASWIQQWSSLLLFLVSDVTALGRRLLLISTRLQQVQYEPWK